MLKRLLYQARAAFLFSIFGFICMSGNLLFFPVVALGFERFKLVENLARDCVYYSWRLFLFFTKVTGYEHSSFSCKKEPSQGALIIANHPSLLDVVFLLARFRRANCIFKQSLIKNIFLAPAIRACNYIPNSQNEELLNSAKMVLKNGERLIVFPEGTRTKDEIVFHKAASYIAVSAASELVLLSIKMQPRSLRKDEPWYYVPNSRVKYEFKELEKIDILNFLKDRPNPVRARLLHKKIEQIYKDEFK